MFILNLFLRSYNLIYKRSVLLTFIYQLNNNTIKLKYPNFLYKEKSK